MIRNIGRLSRRTYLFAALFLIAACLLMSLLPRAASDPVQSAKSVLQAIPLYPGATQVYREDTDTPGGKIDHQFTFCQIECARVTYEAQVQSYEVRNFYHIWARRSQWQGWGSSPAVHSYIYGPRRITRWHLIEPDWPIFTAEYETRRDYMLGINMSEISQGVTAIELIVHRFAPMPSDTPIPTLVPPPPTAPLPIVPASERTQEPNIPFPLPTAP